MNHAEGVLLAHLPDEKSLDVLVREGFSSEDVRQVIPTVLIRDILKWCLDIYFEAGRQVAASREAIEDTWGDEMEKLDLVIEDETEPDPIEWAIEQLRTKYVEYHSQQFVHDFSKEINEAAPPEKVSVLKTQAQKLYDLSYIVVSHRAEAPADQGLIDAVDRYNERAVSNNILSGLTFGLSTIDHHIMGVHPGELAIFAAFSGMGKSWVAVKTVLAEWERGRRSVLYTLENPLDMTFDRMACMSGGVVYEDWQRGAVSDEEMNRVLVYLDRIKGSEHAPLVIMPQRGDRSALSLIRHAFSLGAESIVIDQLSHVEGRRGSRARERRDVFSEKIEDIKALISEGAEKIPALVLHQIKREGQREARKSGRYVMDDMAESSQIEREADFVFAPYQNDEHRENQTAIWQSLKCRRVNPRDWPVHWRLDVGDIRVLEGGAGV